MFAPSLPPAPSWYPGHMSHFTRLLPAFLTRTDIVIELRDARLPLTSINPAFESAIRKWQTERRNMGAHNSVLCERIVVLGKKDLVGQWGIRPFSKAMQKHFPDQRIHFTSHTQNKTVRELNETLVSIAFEHAAAAAAQEINVLVVGMPNVGKSTLLNALRTLGIHGPTPKALRTSAHPGLTRALSTRLKLSLDPLIYAYDSPGVMVPFLGRGYRGAERGVKLALIAGIKEGMYDVEALAAYLVYRLWVLNPLSPVYMTLLPPSTPQPTDVHEFLDVLSTRLGMIRKGGERDLHRAAVWFIRWWRETGGLLSAQAMPPRHHEEGPDPSPLAESVADLRYGATRRTGWGFDFEWDAPIEPTGDALRRIASPTYIQEQMQARIEAHARELDEEQSEGDNISATQKKKKDREEKIARRRFRREERP